MGRPEVFPADFRAALSTGAVMDFDELIDARLARSALWDAARRGKLTTAELYARLRELRALYGDALYDRPGRR